MTTLSGHSGSPVVVAGMHRSGTSLVSSMLSRLGIAMGDQLLGSDRNNRRGYFEDLGFLGLQRQLLLASTRADDGGHPDWGWTESEWLDRGRFQEFEQPARALIAERNGGGVRWGWKDPRTTLLLDFWQQLLDDPFYVLVYRFPWEVADSMGRLGAEVFLRHPDYAYRIWAFYNRRLLDFYRRHRDRSLLLSTDAFLHRPQQFLELLAGRLGLQAAQVRIEDLLDRELFQCIQGDDPLVSLAAASHADCAALLAELDAGADVSSADFWHAAPLAARPRRFAAATEPRVAVVIPCCDHGEFLIEAVASAERSVPEPWELIIVNDGSREARTLEVLDVLRRGGYRIVDQEHSGLAAARNRGIELARAPYILPLDADNRLRPGFVQQALQVLDRHPDVGVVYGDRHDFGLRSETVDVPPFDLDQLLPFNFIDACALLRKEVWSTCGGYDPAMPAPGWEDWDLWIGAAEREWRFHHLPGAAFDYRVRPASMLSSFAHEEVRGRVQAYVIDKHRELYWRRLPEILLAAQGGSGELSRLARAHEQLHADAGAALAAQALQLEAGAVEREDLQAEIGALLAERKRFAAELRAWSERVAFMEGTRAWRLRQRLVDFRCGLRRRSPWAAAKKGDAPGSNSRPPGRLS